MHPSTTRAGSGGSSGAHHTRSAPPLYLPPTHIPDDMPLDVAQSFFTHYPLEGGLPYRLRSRAQITTYAGIALVIPDDEWHEVPALGERVCQEVDDFHSIIALIDAITNEMGTFVPAKRAFHLPPSLFAEVPVLMAIYNTHTGMSENVLVHFQGARAYLQHISSFEEKGHTHDPCEQPDVIAVGASLIAAGSLSTTHPRDEVYLPADSNRAIWTPFWECYSTGHTFKRILAIAQRNAHLFDEVAAGDGNDPRNVPNSWRLWPSVLSDLSPPRWLTEHRLRAAVPHNLESGRYAYQLIRFTDPYHGDFVMRHYYHTLSPCIRKGRAHTRRRRRRAPVARPCGPPPKRAIGCQLPEWLVALDPDKPPPSALSPFPLPAHRRPAPQHAAHPPPTSRPARVRFWTTARRPSTHPQTIAVGCSSSSTSICAHPRRCINTRAGPQWVERRKIVPTRGRSLLADPRQPSLPIPVSDAEAPTPGLQTSGRRSDPAMDFIAGSINTRMMVGSTSTRMIGTTQTHFHLPPRHCLVWFSPITSAASAWFHQPGLSTLGLGDHRHTVLISVVVCSGMTYNDRNQDSPPITSDPVSIRVPYSLTSSLAPPTPYCPHLLLSSQSSQAYLDAPFSGGTRVNIPHRDSHMPTLWRVNRHPTIPLDARVDGCLMFWMNTKKDVLGALYSYLKAVDIPEGSREAMQSCTFAFRRLELGPPVARESSGDAVSVVPRSSCSARPIPLLSALPEYSVNRAGYLALDPYWYVFAQDINGSHDPKDDVLQLWLIARSGMPDWVFQRFRLARNTDLGPAEERAPNKLHKVNGEFTQEGVHYERSPLANSLKKNDRAYPLTMSHEQTRKLSGPCVGTKFEEEVSEHNKLRSETVAMNLVSTQPASQGSKQMKAELGRVGGKHFDSHDTAGGIISMITDSDINSDMEDWGWFAICDLGIVIELWEFIVANFCGLHFHGRFAPTAKPAAAVVIMIDHVTAMTQGCFTSVYGRVPDVSSHFRPVRHSCQPPVIFGRSSSGGTAGNLLGLSKPAGGPLPSIPSPSHQF
ncbi:hypothetical protein LXA43DRAFT_1157853 [Ganoderma leucocontextum]|nr:hypothetical protein LXA43DRAFT_1157853 [Ganoderma leucocontextum]